MRHFFTAALSCLLCATLYAAPALNVPTTEALAVSSTGAIISVEIPEPSLSVLDRGENGEALYVEIPGTTPDFDMTGIVLPTLTKLIEVPDGYRAEVRVRNARVRDFSVDAMIPRDRLERVLRPTEEPGQVEVGDAGWMRWLRIAPVVIRPAVYNAETNTIQVAERLELEFEFIPDGTTSGVIPDRERYWSIDYANYFNAMLLNPGDLPNILPGGRVVTRGTYLVITDSALVNYTTQFAEWKRAKGFNVVVAPIGGRGSNNATIKQYITNAYNTWERPPEYILLLGDVHLIPPFTIRNPFPGINENDPTDLPYGLIAGDDYYPDILVGRVSSDSPNSAITQNFFARLIRHERDVHSFRPEGFSRAVIFAGNRGDGGSVVLSPVETAEWLADRLRETGYDVYTQMWRKVGDNDDPASIVEAINRGCNIVAYRGWADAHGTHYPRFYTENLDQLNNGPLLPVMTFFVCNTGDIDNENRQLCFGEYSICRGSRLNPTGAIAFYGPSDLHTKTTFNNSMLAGYYNGLMYQNIRTFGFNTLRSKMEVWRTNPHLRVRGGDNNFVEFYFSVYNNLGDPETTVYFKRPGLMSISAPERMSVGESNARFVVSNESGRPLMGALVNVRQGAETEISVMTDHMGVALVPVNLLTSDTLYATVIAHDFAPLQRKIPVVASARLVGFESVAVQNEDDGDRITAGTPLDLTISLKNFGSSVATGVSATLSAPLEGVEILQAESNFGDIAVGATASSQTPFRVRISPAHNHNASLPLLLTIRDGQGAHPTALFRLVVTNGMISIVSHSFDSEYLNPGSAETLTFTVNNWSVLPVTGLSATLSCFDNSLEILDGAAEFGDVAEGASATCTGDPFRVRVMEGTAIGRQIPLRVHLFDADNTLLDILFYNIVVGNPGPTDPIGPDAYGYYSYDNIDVDYASHPTYDWVELDPAFEGTGGTEHIVGDDSTFTLELPFAFKFYGEEYRHLSVCSNGWASFDQTSVWDFNNWPILSPLGPHTMLAPFWEDLVGHDPGNHEREDMKIFHRYDADSHRFIVEWSRAIARSGNDIENLETFEIILFDPEFVETPTGDGEIVFQYQEVHVVDRGNVPYDYCTIGIQDWEHARGIGLTFANIAHPSAPDFNGGLAIRFTTVPPDGFLNEGGERLALPSAFRLGEPFPNPFNAQTSIDFDLPFAGQIEAGLYDLNGRFMLSVKSGYYTAGRHTLEFDASNMPSGMYLLRVDSESGFGQRKITLLK